MKTPCTVFHIDGERGLRGGERQLLYLACYLQSAGYQNIVACRQDSALDREAQALSLRRLHLPFLMEWDPVSALRLRRAAAAAGPALLHAHTAHAAGLARLASCLGGPPWVAHRRVDFRVGRLSAALKYGAAGAVLAVSSSVADLLASVGLPRERLKTVPDCIPIDDEEARMAGLPRAPGPVQEEERSRVRQALARRLGLPVEAAWIGNVAALVPHKDQATLLKAVAAVRRKAPRSYFILVGDGPERRSLEALSRELGIGDFVRFAGHQSEPLAWLRSLDVLALSSWGEGFGSVLLEALACRVPVVATTAGGIPEVIEHGRTGLLVPPRDPERLAEALVAVLADPAARRAVTERGASALARFGLRACGRQVEEVYASLPGDPP